MANLLLDRNADLTRTYGSHVLVADRGGSSTDWGVNVAGALMYTQTTDSMADVSSLTHQFDQYLAYLAHRTSFEVVQLISSGTPYRNDDGELCVRPQNGRDEVINATRISQLASVGRSHPVPVFICNDVEGLVAVVWGHHAQVVRCLTPDVQPDPEGSVYTLMFATGMGGCRAQRVPGSGLLAYSGMEPGHLPTPELLPHWLQRTYPYLAKDIEATYDLVTRWVRRRWTSELGGCSNRALFYAYQAIRGDADTVLYDGTQAKTIARLADARDHYALRAMQVVTFQLANAIYSAALTNVTGGIRIWGPLVGGSLDLMLDLGLMDFISEMDPTGRESYDQLVRRTPIEVVSMPKNGNLLAAALTARAQMLLT